MEMNLPKDEAQGLRKSEGFKSLSQSEKFRKKAKPNKRRRCRDTMIDQEKLPTPPPDPTVTNVFDEAFVKHKETETLKKELNNDFQDYLENRRPSNDSHPGSISRTAAAFAANFADTEEAFDHLEKLVLLMEQVINLRDRNSKMFRRVRELERIKALRNADWEVERVLLSGEDIVLPEEDVGFADSLLEAMISSGAEVTTKRSFRSPPVRQRSKSIGIDHPAMLAKQISSSGTSIQSKKRFSVFGGPKVSKWTKVKAAFKWERAGTGDTIDPEIMRFLRVPDNNDASTGSGSLSRTGDHSGPPSPGTLSSSSSTEDVFQGAHKRPHSGQLTVRTKEDITKYDDPSRRSRSLDGDVLIPHNAVFSTHVLKDGTRVRKFEKGHSKTPWGKVKDMIHLRRENIRRQPPRGSIRSEDGYSISSLESSEILQELLQFEYGKGRVQITTSECPTVLSSKPSSPGSEIVDLASRRLTPTLTITVPSSEELRSISSPESISPLPSHFVDSAEERSPSEEFEFSKNTSILGRSKTWQDVPSTMEFKRQNFQKGESSHISRLSRQDSKWNKVKRAFLTNTTSVPPSPSRISSFFDETDMGRSYSASAEDLETDISSSVQVEIQRNYQLLHDKLSTEFYRKLAEWEKLKSTSPTGLRHSHSSQESNSRNKSSPRDRDSSNALLLSEEQLTPEFKKKLDEWKRIKKGSPGITTPDQQVFKRRLTDWQIWRAPSKSETKPEGDSSKAHLSDDFLKKMEEWKKIKAARLEDDHEVPGRKNSIVTHSIRNSKVWKAVDEREFQPLGKVLGKIEKLQSKEKPRDTVLDREARLSMLKRQSGGSSPRKKEVLVHTSTGFFRFEGISQEFTRKLYEWEKSQGISPESSTFRFLNPAYRISAGEKGVRPILKRSKSVGSIVEGSTREETPIRQLSSLSLNDVEKLDAEAKSRADSEQTIAEEEISEEIAMDDSEPEAMIVDIEDVIEETACPMAKLQPHQTPVYCVAASETTSIAIPLGTVTSSHEPSPVILIEAGEDHPISNRVMMKNQTHSSHSSIAFTTQESSANEERVLTKEFVESKHSETQSVVFNKIKRSRTILRGINDRNVDKSKRNKSEMDKLIGHPGNKKTLAAEELKLRSTNYGSSGNKDADAVVEIQECNSRRKESVSMERISFNADASTLSETERRLVINSKKEQQRAKLNRIVDTCLETSQSLDVLPVKDYMNAVVVTDVMEPETPKESLKRIRLFDQDVYQKPKSPGKKESQEKSLAAIANDLASGTKVFENALRRCSVEEDEVVITVDRDIRPKKVLKTRRLTDTQVGYKWRSKIEETDSSIDSSPLMVSAFRETPDVERIIINESTLNKIVVPTASTEPMVQDSNLDRSTNNERISSDVGETSSKKEKQESRSVFVKTKRMIFSPFRRNSKDKGVESQKENEKDCEEFSEMKIPSEVVSGSSALETPPAQSWANLQRARSNSESPCSRERRRVIDSTDQRRPPLPQSPILSRKEYRRTSPKETAPSIRMMIQRYNQKLEDAGSPASSGSGSPIWRSPVTERRVRTQMEKYQEEVRKAIAGPIRGDVLKSASTSLIRDNISTSALNSPVPERSRRNEILKSTSADFIKNRHFSTALSLKIDEEGNEITHLKKEKSKENISPDLIHKLAALSSAAAQKEKNSPTSFRTSGSDLLLSRSSTINLIDDSQAEESDDSSPSKLRALRLQRAKEDFLSRGPSCYSHDPSNASRQDEIVFDFETESIDFEDRPDLIKSASAGMIHVDPRTFERLASNRACDSLPRSAKKPSDVSSRLSQIANKFRRARLKRAKEKESKLSTVSMLCRQSLLVDIQPEGASKSCPTSPSPLREDDDCNRFKKHRESN
ncbi:uncharacterized protein LOC117171167 isoform X2 [Belonocnema kinseyi]|uniref:uncharacterized protein LOC117171167 isoform X2 n=1 Tax=Belonocnema kinseyi TaxID=2817044 RepID=UPI00143D39FC|nr:uncharacterized protein LOC117171167 isoform X2 [Belonocnema kinseyi]